MDQVSPESHSPSSGLPVPESTKSFWHSEPDSFLIGHQTTADLPAHVRTIIVGSGITGASAARWMIDGDSSHRLCGDDELVLMLEAREACWGATGRNGGHLQPFIVGSTPEIARFELDNCREVATYIQQHDIKCEFRQTSSCHTYWTPKLASEAIEAIKNLKADLPELASLVTLLTDSKGMRKAKINSSCECGTTTTGAASLWPYKYVSWILKRLIQDGKLNLQTTTPVIQIEPITSETGISSARYKVHTPRGTITCHNILLATNAYTSHLLPSFSDLIVPIRETMTALVPPKSLQNNLLPHTYGFAGLGADPNPASTEYLIHRPLGPNAGHLMLGGGRITAATLPSVGQWDDSVLDTSVVSYLRRALPRALDLDDGADELDAAAAGTGIWAASRDGAPWVGAVPGMPPGLWMCAAYTGHGMPNATLCARAVVGMMAAEVQGGAESVASKASDMVTKREIPGSYIVSRERMERARELPGVEEQQRLGIFRYHLATGHVGG